MAWIITRFLEATLTENRRTVSITVWDSDTDPTPRSGPVYRWNGYEETDSVLSLLRYVEIHAVRLRNQYLAWIHELGESRLDGKRLIEHLAFEADLSYWWLTQLVEQSAGKSPSIIDAIRLLALEEIVLEQRPDTLLLVSAKPELREILSDLCRNLGVTFEWELSPDDPPRRSLVRRIYNALPHAVQAMVRLARHLRARWALRETDKSGWFSGDRALFVGSYFIHLDEKSCSNGQFHSRHWEGLPKLLHESGYRTNWMQHYLQSSVVPDTEVAKAWVRRFNQQSGEQGFHAFLDAYLSWRVVLRILRSWFRLNLICWRLRNIRPAFTPRGSHFSLWPIMREEWQASLRGGLAITNLLWIALFDAALRDLPRQQRGLYLCENQGWERAFIHAWRKYGHGQLIGVAHSTVRFWDLRYFTDPRTIRSRDPYPLPQPDLIALNGKTAVDAYLNMDYPREGIVECEAVRYSHLLALRSKAEARKAKGTCLRVLILGDYSAASTVKMMQLLESAAAQVSIPAAYTMKPHPNFVVKAESYPTLQLNVVFDPLGQILHDFDIAYSSNATSAAVDACIAGLPVVVMLDASELNFSPLRGHPGIRFVARADELAEALQSGACGSVENVDHNELFFLDPELPRWKRLLGLGAVDA